MTIWTGETRGSRWEKIALDKCPNGFRILEDTPFGKTSHGVFFGGITYRIPYQQTASFKLGFDSEKVRHFFQNRLIHDALIVPFPIKRNAPHYPMLDETGCAAFDPDEVRKSSFFMQLGANENWSY